MEVTPMGIKTIAAAADGAALGRCLFAALLALLWLTTQARADDGTAPNLLLQQSVAQVGSNGAYTLTLADWPAPARPAAAHPSAVRLGNRPLLPPCAAAASSDPCFDAGHNNGLLTVELRHLPQGAASQVLHLTGATAAPDDQLQLGVVFSSYGPAIPRIVAAVATLVLIAIIVLGVNVTPDVRLTNGQSVSRLRAMVVDKATSSYSLSKLQLYLWLLAGIATYLYLLFARALIQNDWTFIDVPPSVVSVTLIAVSTSVLSSGVKSANGGQGSGPFTPTLADFITSGGDVAPERVQQLLWTLIGAPLFVVLAYRCDPATISNVQNVPNEFLQLMGVSSAGYVGGMIARGPGPKITAVTARNTGGPPAPLLLSVTGSDIQTVGATYYFRDLEAPGNAAAPLAATILPTSKIDSNGVATQLKLSAPMPNPKPGFAPGKSQFTIRASDGEIAEWVF